MKLNPKKKYLQVALNNTLDEACKVIQLLPVSDRVIIEVGTPLIKRYGEQGIRSVRNFCEDRFSGRLFGAAGVKQAANFDAVGLLLGPLIGGLVKAAVAKRQAPAAPAVLGVQPYIAADLKTMDRGETEVDIAWRGGADAAIALGTAPLETLNAFVKQSGERGLDSMVDMMNVEYPLSVLSQMKKLPDVVILHRGVDEEHFNKEKQIPLYEIRRIKSRYDIMISVAGGDSIREVQRSIFNDADIVVIWKSVYQTDSDTVSLIGEFLKEIK